MGECWRRERGGGARHGARPAIGRRMPRGRSRGAAWLLSAAFHFSLSRKRGSLRKASGGTEGSPRVRRVTNQWPEPRGVVKAPKNQRRAVWERACNECDECERAMFRTGISGIGGMESEGSSGRWAPAISTGARGVMVQWGARYSTCRLSRKGEMGYKDRAHGRGQEQSTRHACGAAFMTQWTDGRDSGERMGLWQENDERMMMITPSGDWGQGAWHA